jgi:O-antigen/teichoic acid export membrane protein
MIRPMRKRLFWRRSAAAAGIYSSAVLGFLGTVVALHIFSTHTFGLYALVLATTGFFQSFLDVTVEEALIKFGFRYTTREDWGRLRRLFKSAIAFKLAGGILAAVVIAALAPLADTILHKSGLSTPLYVAALLPLVQCVENVGGVGLILRGRYDLRGFFLFTSMALRSSRRRRLPRQRSALRAGSRTGGSRRQLQRRSALNGEASSHSCCNRALRRESRR